MFKYLEEKFKVLATMFLSVADNLPKTSYIKMVDVWLIVTLAFPFLEVFYNRTSRLSKRNFQSRSDCRVSVVLSWCGYVKSWVWLCSKRCGYVKRGVVMLKKVWLC